jgi:exosortase
MSLRSSNAAGLPRGTPPVSAGLLILALVLLGYWAVLAQRLSGSWTALPEYSYGWVVPLLCAMLFWDRWQRRPPPHAERKPLRRRAGGMDAPAQTGGARAVSGVGVLLTGGLLGVFVLARVGVEVIPTWRFALWAMALAVAGLTWLGLGLAGGGAWARHFFFPVAFFFLAVPWPTQFELPFIQTLTQLNASLTVELMSLLGVTAVRMGNLILIEPGMVGVQEACSGIRSFQSTLMVALFLGELFRFNLWRRAVFVVLGATCSLGFNLLRTSFLVWSCDREGLGAADKFHDPAGWAVFAASFAVLAVIAWRLKRGDDREKAERQAAEALRAVDAAPDRTERPNPESGRTASVPSASATSPASFITPSARPALLLAGVMLVVLLGTELGLRAWFATHRQARAATLEWELVPDAPRTRELPITRQVQSLLAYDHGEGWETQDGPERWQGFYFRWDAPRSLGRRIICNEQVLGHQPEVCFTAAGMQVRQIYGPRRYTANGVPLVFKVYEFTDRNVPIFVFSCTWERGVEQRLDEGPRIEGEASTARGFREARLRLARGERGVVDEARVLKLGVWGPRTLAEAEAALLRQLERLIRPAATMPTGGTAASPEPGQGT